MVVGSLDGPVATRHPDLVRENIREIPGGMLERYRHADGSWDSFDNVMGETGNLASFLAVSGIELFSTSTEAVIP